MAVYDFSAPFVAARIILPDGSAYPLWTNVGGAETIRPTIPNQPDLQALCFVQEVQVQLSLAAGLPQISIQLSPPFEDGLKFLDSPLADGRRTNRLEVQLGYAGGTGGSQPVLSPPYVAALHAPEVTVSMEVQISLKGNGLGDSVRNQNGQAVARPNETRRALIQRIAQGSGGRRPLVVDFKATEGSEAEALLDEPPGSYSQGGRTDWLALWELAEQTRCIMTIVGQEAGGGRARLLWMPRRAEPLDGSNPVRRYRLYHYPGGQLQGVLTEPGQEVEVAELPLLSFSCNTEAVWTALTYADVLNHGARLRGVDPDTVEPSEHTATVESVADPVDAGEGAQTLDADDTADLPEAVNHLPGDPDNASAVERVNTEVAAGGPMTFSCDIETVGDPAVLPGDAVRLSGLGNRFDYATYHVMEVTHSIGVGGFSTNMKVQSNIDATRSGRTPTGQPATSDVRPQVGYTAQPGEGQTLP